MKWLKPAICLALVVILLTVFIASCKGKAVRVSLMQDDSAVGIVNLVEKDSKIRNGLKANYSFSFSPTVKSASAVFAESDADVAVISADKAALLYAGNKDIVCIGYVSKLSASVYSQNSEALSVSDLSGKSIYFNSNYPVLEHIFRKVYEENGLNPNISIKFRKVDSNNELREIANSGTSDRFVLSGLPFSASLVSSSDAKRIVDIAGNFEQKTGITPIGACIITTGEYAKKNKAKLGEFLKEYKDSIQKCTLDNANSADLAVKYGIASKKVTASTILYSGNLDLTTGKECKKDMTEYYKFLYSEAPVLIGKVPSDDFYLEIK